MTTRAELRRRVGANLGARLPITPTVRSATELQVPAALNDPEMPGRYAFVNDSAYRIVRAINSGVDAILTLDGNLGTTPVGTEAELWEDTISPASVNEFINQAIVDTHRRYYAPVAPELFCISDRSRIIPRPGQFHMVRAVQHRQTVEYLAILSGSTAWILGNGAEVVQDTHDYRFAPAARFNLAAGVSALRHNVGQMNLTGMTHIELWLKSNVVTQATLSLYAGETDKADFTITVGRQWAYYHLPIVNPYDLDAIDNIRISVNANSLGALWVDTISAVNADSAFWADVGSQKWRVLAETGSVEVLPMRLPPVNSMVRLMGGRDAPLLTADDQNTTVDAYYLVARATELAFSPGSGGAQVDPDRKREQVRLWGGRANLAFDGLPVLGNVRRIYFEGYEPPAQDSVGTGSIAGIVAGTGLDGTTAHGIATLSLHNPVPVGYVASTSVDDNTTPKKKAWGAKAVGWLGSLTGNAKLAASAIRGLAAVATSGSYNDLTDKPAAGGVLPDVSNSDNNSVLAVSGGSWGKRTQEQMATAIATALNSLTGAARVSYNSLKDTLAESTQEDAESGTSDTAANASRMTPRRTKQAIDAQVTPPHKHIVSFRTEDGSSDDAAGLMHLIKSDNTQWQSGSASENLDAIGLNPSQYTLTQNPQTDNAAYTDFHSLLDDRAQNGSSVLMFFYYMGSGVALSDVPSMILQADTIIRNLDGTYALQMITVLKDFTLTGTGYNWQVSVGEASFAGWDSVFGVPNYVKTADLVGDEADRYASYTNAFIASSYRVGSVCLFSQATLPTDDTNAIGQPDIADRATNGVIAFGKTLRDDRDPNRFHAAAAESLSDYTSGTTVHISVWNDPSARVAVTLTSDAQESGTGNAAFFWATATWDEVNDIPDVTDVGNYFRLARTIPGTVFDEMTDELDAEFVRRDGSNVDPELIARIQGDNEESTLSNIFTINDTSANYYIQITTTGTPNIRIRMPSSESGGSDDTDLKRLLKPRAWVEIGEWKVDVKSNATRSIIGTSLTYAFDYIAVSGAIPANSSTHQPRVVGEDVHRGEIARQAFGEESPSIAGKGGNQWNLWVRGSGASNAAWQSLSTLASRIATALNNLTGAARIKSASVSVDASGFDGNLATTDTDVQKVAQKLDDMSVGGGGASLPDQTGHAGEFLKTDGSDADWDTPSLLGFYDSGTLTNASDVAVSDTDAIPPPADVDSEGLIATEDISGFGKVFKLGAVKSVTFNFNYDATQGVAIQIRYSDTKPTSSSDAKSFGTQAVQISDGNPDIWTGFDIPANRYFWFALSGGGTRTLTDRSLRVRIAHEASEPVNLTVVATGTEVTHASGVYAITPATALTAYTEGVQVIAEIPTGGANTGAADINVSGLGNKDVVREDGAQLSGGELPAGHYGHFIYDGIFFVLQNRYRKQIYGAAQTNNDIGTSDEDIATGLSDDDFLVIELHGTASGVQDQETFMKRFGDIGTNDRIFLGYNSNNQAALLTRSGSALRARRGGGLSSLTSSVRVLALQ